MMQNDRFDSNFMGELFLCYRDLNRMTGEELGRKKKSNGLEMFVKLTAVSVSKMDLMTMFPELSKITIERTLRDMCNEEEIVMVGSGRSTRYIRKSHRNG